MARRRAAKSPEQPAVHPGGLEPNGMLCGMCYGLQYSTPSGTMCNADHGGVDGVEPPHLDNCPVPYGASADCAPPGSCAEAAVRLGWRPDVPDAEEKLVGDEQAGKVARPLLASEFLGVDVAVLMETDLPLRGAKRDYRCHFELNGSNAPCDSCSTTERPRAQLYLRRESKVKGQPDVPKSWEAGWAGGESVSFSVWLCRVCCTIESLKRAKRNRIGGRQFPEHEPHEDPTHQPSPASGSARAVVRFVGVHTTPLVQLNATPYKAPEDVKGAIVKVSPVLRASERDSFNGAALARELRAAGAIAVQLAPVTIPDTVTHEAQRAVAAAASPHEAVRAYFAEVRGVSEEDRAAAEQLAMELVEATLA